MINGRSNYLLREPSRKRAKYNEYKELELTNNDLDQKNAELYAEIDSLKDKVNEYKMLHIEALAAKEKLEKNIKEGFSKESEDERIEF